MFDGFQGLKARIAQHKAEVAEKNRLQNVGNLVIGTELAGGDKITEAMVQELTDGKGED